MSVFACAQARQAWLGDKYAAKVATTTTAATTIEVIKAIVRETFNWDYLGCGAVKEEEENEENQLFLFILCSWGTAATSVVVVVVLNRNLKLRIENCALKKSSSRLSINVT